MKPNLTLLTALLLLPLAGLYAEENAKLRPKADPRSAHAEENLIPDKPTGRIYNYFCTWAAQGYMHGQGQEHIDLDDLRGPNIGVYAKAAMNQKNLTEGKNAWLKFFPGIRGELWFMLDDGHAVRGEDKSILKAIDPVKFPMCAGRDDTESLKIMTKLVKDAGWHGLGIWIGDTKPELNGQDAAGVQAMLGRFQQAGVGYCKIDQGDTTMEYCKARSALGSDLVLEHSVWMQGVYTGEGETEMDTLLPRVATPQHHRYLRGTDVVRIYDSDQPMNQITALLRTAALMKDAGSDPSATAVICTEDHASIAGALGCSFALLRFPVTGLRPDGDVDIFNAGPRHVKRRMDEVARVIRWQRIAPPLPAGALPVTIDDRGLVDQWDVKKDETWSKKLGLISQSAPARISRGLPLPEVECDGLKPFVLACRHPRNGPVAVTTLGRFSNSWGYRIPLADVAIEVGEIPELVGIFGRYATLTFRCSQPIGNVRILAQDLAANASRDITSEVQIRGRQITIPGSLIQSVGLAAATPGDESDPGMVLKICPPSRPSTASLGTKPTIARAVGPVRPGETVLLMGDWPATAAVEVAPIKTRAELSARSWQKIEPLQTSSQSLKFAIPASWAMGAYACRVVDGGAPPSAPVTLNLPDPWWLLGNAGATVASPGGWLRIFGKALHFQVPSQVRLEGAGRKIELVAPVGKDAGGYALTMAMPADIPAGTYAVAVHNGFGGSDAWSLAGHIRIRPAPLGKQDVFDVSKFGPLTNDCTAAIKAALAQAASNGGGVVYFPRGRYRINETLVVPAHVTVKGEGEALVSLHWPAREKALDSLITGSDDFAVEDLAIYTHGVHKNVISGRNNVRVQRVRIRANFFFRHDFVGKPTGSLDDGLRINPVVEATNRAGAGVLITGDNAVITDCDIYHSLFGFVLRNTFGGLIARNRIDCGGGGFQTYCISRVVIEENEIGGAALWASGNSISLYYGCAAYHVYFAHNRIRQVYGGDREALTTDGHGTAYFGKIASVQGPQVTLADDSWWGNANKDMITVQDFQKTIERNRPAGELAAEEWHGVTLYILSGRGAGQYGNILECAGREVKIEHPFAVEPDASSVVSIGKFQGRHLIVGNEFRDAKQSVQLYAPCCDSVVAENQAWRTDCMNSGAVVMGKRAEPGWFNQFLNNHVWEGNGWAGNAMELVIMGNLRVSSADPAIRELAPSLGHVVRGNQLDNNASIRVDGEVKDVIIERNVVQNTEQGVTVRASTNAPANSTPPLPGRVWVGDNSFHNVAIPVVAPK